MSSEAEHNPVTEVPTAETETAVESNAEQQQQQVESKLEVSEGSPNSEQHADPSSVAIHAMVNNHTEVNVTEEPQQQQQQEPSIAIHEQPEAGQVTTVIKHEEVETTGMEETVEEYAVGQEQQEPIVYQSSKSKNESNPNDGMVVNQSEGSDSCGAVDIVIQSGEVSSIHAGTTEDVVDPNVVSAEAEAAAVDAAANSVGVANSSTLVGVDPTTIPLPTPGVQVVNSTNGEVAPPNTNTTGVVNADGSYITSYHHHHVPMKTGPYLTDHLLTNSIHMTSAENEAVAAAAAAAVANGAGDQMPSLETVPGIGVGVVPQGVVVNQEGIVDPDLQQQHLHLQAHHHQLSSIQANGQEAALLNHHPQASPLTSMQDQIHFQATDGTTGLVGAEVGIPMGIHPGTSATGDILTSPMGVIAGPAHKKRRVDVVSWEERFQQLDEFKAQHGHCNVPQRYAANKSLGNWVSTQRTQYRLRQNGKTSNITADRVQKLEEVGFEWEVKKPACPWDVRYKELVEFKLSHGHCNVPQRYRSNKSLGNWVTTQRSQYRLMKQGKSSHIKQERIGQLESIGFQWEVSKPSD